MFACDLKMTLGNVTLTINCLSAQETRLFQEFLLTSRCFSTCSTTVKTPWVLHTLVGFTSSFGANVWPKGRCGTRQHVLKQVCWRFNDTSTRTASAGMFSRKFVVLICLRPVDTVHLTNDTIGAGSKVQGCPAEPTHTRRFTNAYFWESTRAAPTLSLAVHSLEAHLKPSHVSFSGISWVFLTWHYCGH